ncbi:MAG: PQQ-binding-like beta-propeller repeat protein [Gemmatales bacterium]|nr:PQQ-binding-like beta-propeller repeat protein [Gemmatales bacterium]MDW8387526.1 PQQ-binding-like beta-propeller repeat protein [Gemmatales bacterium]
MLRVALCVALTLAYASSAPADWPTVRGNAQRTGYVDKPLNLPLQVAWVRHLQDERIGAAVEPVVAEGRLFIGTHNGNLYALDAKTGEPLWRFAASGAFLHAPTVHRDQVVAGCADGHLYALDAATGRMRWAHYSGPGGYAASPLLAEGLAIIGSRLGELVAVRLDDGSVAWRQQLKVPIRQTAAYDAGRVFVTAEDLRLRCYEASNGRLVWASEPLIGQTAREYYPVIVRHGDTARVVVRTNPIPNMAQRLSADRQFLCRQANVNDSDWKNLDAWTRNPEAMGNEELWRREQEAIRRYLREQPLARTFYQFDAATGKPLEEAPVLWIGGCQSVGTPPVALPDGRMFVFYRSAYGNWNLGVAPLVALGFLDPSNRITPLRHRHGMQPPWNTFWGTADESQNFVIAGEQVLIVHQSTLSLFDLKTQTLRNLAGERDSWGGYRNLTWARNEWNGPARSGVAVAGNHVYWQTGSRLLCLGPEKSAGVADIGIDGRRVPTHQAPRPPKRDLRKELASAVTELLEQRWAPLLLEPGLAGREIAFEHSSEVFDALSAAYPHLPEELKSRVRDYLAEPWRQHPPFTAKGWYALDQGTRREYFTVPPEALAAKSTTPQPHPFGNLYVVLRYAERCGQWDRLRDSWPEIRQAYLDFKQRNWKLDPSRGDLYANRYLSSLWAFSRIAERMEDQALADESRKAAQENTQALIAWWQRSAEQFRPKVFRDISDWDHFINHGDGLLFCIRPHKMKIALFHDLTPELAATIRQQAPQAAAKMLEAFEQLCPTWHLVHEERQLHYGENLYDPPDFALDAFRAMLLLRDPTGERNEAWIDIPSCKADLTYITKLAMFLETS